MRHVEHPEQPVYQGQSDGDKGIDAAQHQPLYDEFYVEQIAAPDRSGIGPGCRNRAAPTACVRPVLPVKAVYSGGARSSGSLMTE